MGRSRLWRCVEFFLQSHFPWAALQRRGVGRPQRAVDALQPKCVGWDSRFRNVMKRHQWTLAVMLAVCAGRAAGQTAVDLSRQGKVGSGTTLPAQCTVGQIFFKTDAPAGTNLFACTTANTWGSVGLPTLGGDARGTQPSVTVQGLQGRGVSAAAPADQNVLRWNATSGQWEPGVAPSTGTAAPPATCTAGSFYLRNDAANNIQQFYVCSNTNTWGMAS